MSDRASTYQRRLFGEEIPARSCTSLQVGEDFFIDKVCVYMNILDMKNTLLWTRCFSYIPVCIYKPNSVSLTEARLIDIYLGLMLPLNSSDSSLDCSRDTILHTYKDLAVSIVNFILANLYGTYPSFSFGILFPFGIIASLLAPRVLLPMGITHYICLT